MFHSFYKLDTVEQKPINEMINFWAGENPRLTRMVISTDMKMKLFGSKTGNIVQATAVDSTEDIEDWNATLYELADRMRMRKDKGEFISYRKAYKWAVKHTTINGQPIEGWSKLERAYEKAKDQGLIIE